MSKVVVYAGLAGGILLAHLALRGVSWTGGATLHAVQDSVAVVLAMVVAAIALLRFYSRRSDDFLLLGTTFLGTALFDAYHALSRSRLSLETLSPWSWLASRIYLAGALGAIVALARRREGGGAEPTLDERIVYLAVAVLTLASFAFFTFAPLPSAYVADFPFPRPAELIPAALFGLVLALHLRGGRWRRGGFEHWLALSLLVGLGSELAFMPFARQPGDAMVHAGHLLRSAGYLCVLAGLLDSMYRLFRRADESAVELARVNRALHEEVAASARARLVEEQFFLLSLDLLCIAGTDGYFKQLNPAWEQVLGWSLDELKARPYFELVHPDDVEATRRANQRVRAGGVVIDFENRYRARDGSWRWLSWRASFFAELGLIYAVARDVSGYKKVEQMKDDFVSVVSHELRTPLTSIRGSLGLLSGGMAGELPERACSLVCIAAQNSERLALLIDDILDVEKIESGQMTYRMVPCELAPLVARALEVNQAFADRYDVKLRLAGGSPEARVHADPDRLLQVLTNLLSNAAKFSPRGGSVEVAIGRGRGCVQVSVTDHGRGIPAGFQDRVFEKFAQADASSTRQEGGTGLGLSISKAIVERHGGRIWFASRPGEGTTFTFELPEWAAAAG